MWISQLRLNEITAAKIKHIAKFNKRSINSMIVFLLERYIDDFERINGQIVVDLNDDNA